MIVRLRFTLLLVVLPVLVSSLSAQNYHPVIGNKGMVTSAHPLASQAGIDILKQGGNAIDAAVAIGFALESVFPVAGNIAGGGFAVVRLSSGEVVTLDFREVAPLLAFKTMFMDNGKPNTQAAQSGALAVGVPGTVNGLEKLHKKYGKLPWKKLLEPAIQFAKGHAITQLEAMDRNKFAESFSQFESSRKIFVKPNQWKSGDYFSRPNLAEVLSRISERGSSDFYTGETSKLILNTMQKYGGIISAEDLKNYDAKWRKPIVGTYHDLEIYSMNLPSSGGIILLQTLNALEDYDVRSLGFMSADYIHLVSSALQNAYADRAYFMGDPDFVSVPVDVLSSKKYAKERFKNFTPDKHTPSLTISHGQIGESEKEETTHYSVVDSDGNCVSITYTQNGAFGSFLTVEGGDFLLNNQMDDFSIAPGIPNSYGLIGGEANSIQPGKKMLSSMTPTIILKNKKPYLIIGTPGGSTIPTTVLQTILNITHFDMTVQEAVNQSRFHFQWIPDILYYEKNGIHADAGKKLTSMGYILEERKSTSGRCEAILLDNGIMYGAADYRGDDTAIGITDN